MPIRYDSAMRAAAAMMLQRVAQECRLRPRRGAPYMMRHVDKSARARDGGYARARRARKKPFCKMPCRAAVVFFVPSNRVLSFLETAFSALKMISL